MKRPMAVLLKETKAFFPVHQGLGRQSCRNVGMSVASTNTHTKKINSACAVQQFLDIKFNGTETCKTLSSEDSFPVFDIAFSAFHEKTLIK